VRKEGTPGTPLFGLHSHRPFLEAALPTLNQRNAQTTDLFNVQSLRCSLSDATGSVFTAFKAPMRWIARR
jgi:hypothetical protein